MTSYYNETAKDVLKHWAVDPAKGLNDKTIQERLNQYGKNSLRVAKTPLWRKLLEPFLDIFMIILIVALVLSLVQQDWLEAIAIGVIIVADAIVYYIQRFSTERILQSLQSTLTQTVTVLRNSTETNIDASDLVPGDIVILHEGDRIPADGRIINESGLLTNESMLTGESEAIAKDAKAISGLKKVYEQRNMVFAGAFILTGSGKFVVTATGNNTEYGRIASLASSVKHSSPITIKINRLVFQIAIAVIVLAAIALIVQLANGVAWLDALKFTLAMVVSAVPEGLPIAISIILALCAKRMAKQNALIKELRAIESIGIVTTIASDKTGTLTENRLELKDTWTTLTGREFLHTLASSALGDTALVNTAKSTSFIDPLDICIANYLANTKHPAIPQPIKSYAFDQNIKLSGNLYENSDHQLILELKGAPETILSRARLSASERDVIDAKLLELTGQGYKVIALSNGKIPHAINELHRLDKKVALNFVGLIAVADALRPKVASAITQASRMGVKTKMVTGDHANTAYAIGRELGLATEFSEVLDCSKLGNISDEDLGQLIQNATIFARVTPEDKYRILEIMKKTEVAAMTGDGVNDVPALVNANVGIAMGDSPSIVRDAGDIVLLDNNFRNITRAIRESRTVLANIRRMLAYLLATNAGEAITMLATLFIAGGHLLTPIQILWINLVTDSLLVIPLGLEPPEPHILRAKPEAKDAPILSRPLIIRMAITAVTMACFTIITYFIAHSILRNTAQANTLAFTALVVMQWSNAFSARGIYESAWQRLRTKHHSFWLALLGAVVLQALALFGPFARAVGTVPMGILPLLITVIAAFILPLIIIETYKKLSISKHKK